MLQFVLMAATVALGLSGPGWPGQAHWWLKAAAVLLVFGGALMVVSAARALGSGFTPFPSRRTPGTGAAGAVLGRPPRLLGRHPRLRRHLARALAVGAAGTAALAVLWGLKARVEERFLAATYPGYEEYSSHVRSRLVPLVY